MSRSNLSLSKITATLALCYAIPAYADIQSANSQTQVKRVGSVEIVNIAKPSDAGLSHNQYNKFNVDKSGAVLNNALNKGRSELAGNLDKNPNLQNQAAKVILNEVVSRQPSHLAGHQEVFGQRADYVLANPNGISCDGCGFINTPKASLVVGKPTVSKGELTGFDVKGDKALSTSGKVTNSQVDQLDLIAPTVSVGGDIRGAKNINVVMGKNTVQRDKDGKLTVQVEEAKGAVLDGRVVGSMQAERIRIHSTDNRATLNVEAADIKAKDVLVQAGNANVQGKVTASTYRQNNQYTADRRVKVDESRSGKNEKYQATKIQADNLVVDVDNRLNVSGADIKAKQASIIGGQTHFGTQTTTNESNARKHQSKGLWFREETDKTKAQTVHRTTLAADQLNVVATKGKVTGDAVKLTGQDAFVYGEKGVALKGVAQTTQSEATSNFKNETARLRTGSSSQTANTQELVASELQFKNLTVGGSDVHLSAVKGQIDGQFFVQNKGKAEFVSQATKNTHQLDDKQKFWGGLAGSKTLGSGKDETIQHGTDLTVKGLAYIDASNGVNVKGSRVLAGEGYVLGNQGKLVVDSAQARVIEHQNSRTGTIFNITKARESSFNSVSTAQGSTLASESNLQLISTKGINVIGSKVQAVNTLGVYAPTVEVIGAKNQSLSMKEEAGFGISAKGDKPKVTFNTEAALRGVITSLIKGESVNALNVVKGNTKFEAQGSITLGIYNHKQQTQEVTHTAASLEGGNTKVTAQDVNVVGSKISATQGDLTIQAQNIKTSAQSDRLDSNKKSTTAGITASAKVNESSATGTLSVGVNHKQQNSQTQTAQASQLSAKQNLTLDAERIQHQGSQLSAGNNIAQGAEHIEHSVATNSQNDRTKNVDVGLSVTSSINKDKAISSSVSLSASGGRENSQSTTAQATALNAGNSIVINGKTLQDTATQYQAGGDLTLNSQQHNLQAAVNSSSKDTMKAGVNIGVSGNTSDLKTVNLKVNVGANYQQNQTASEKAQKASLTANNIAVNTNNLYSQADMKADGNINVVAKESATFAQATNKEQQNGVGFKADLGVGALVVPAATAAIPSVDASVSVNAVNGHTQDAVTAKVEGQSINIQSGKNTLVQGTSLAADNINLSGETVNVVAAKSDKQLTDVAVGASVSVGKGVSSLGLKANLKVNHEAANSHTASQVTAQNLNIQSGNGITLAGVQADAKNVTLDSGNGNLALTALQDNVKKTGVGATLSLNGGVAEQKWTPNGGSASLDVNVIRNQTHTSTVVNSETANLNVGGNALLTGSALNADTVSGTVTGDLISKGLVNKVSETSVSVSASGSGKYTPYPEQKWNNNLAQDWNNGSIAGVKADVKLNADIKRETTNTPVNVNAKQNNLVVNGKIVKARLVPEKKANTKVTAHLHTNVEEMVKQANEQMKKGQTPFIQVVTQRK